MYWLEDNGNPYDLIKGEAQKYFLDKLQTYYPTCYIELVSLDYNNCLYKIGVLIDGDGIFQVVGESLNQLVSNTINMWADVNEWRALEDIFGQMFSFQIEIENYYRERGIYYCRFIVGGYHVDYVAETFNRLVFGIVSEVKRLRQKIREEYIDWREVGF